MRTKKVEQSENDGESVWIAWLKSDSWRRVSGRIARFRVLAKKSGVK
jgi:hypothetical protein